MSLNELVAPLVPQDIIVHDLTVTGSTTHTGNITVTNSNPSIAIRNNATNTNRATLELDGRYPSIPSAKVQQNQLGDVIIETFATNGSISLLPKNLGTVNVSRLVIGSTSTLTNYTEGVIVPVLQFGGASTGITYNLQTGKYTNIGNRCDFVINIALTSKGGAVGNATIDGLPFLPVAGNVYTTLVYSSNLTSATASQYFGNITNLTGTIVNLLQVQNSSGTSSALTDTNFANNSTLIVQGYYFTA